MSVEASVRAFHRACSPISSEAFYHELRKIWTPNPRAQIQKLGLAVSGGVDSMALAYLCSNLPLLSSAAVENVRFQFHPFIVDHRARDGSTEEARGVAQRLKAMLGVEPEILTLQWSKDIHPSLLTDFETQARRLRFQALGSACRRHEIESLLLAHHGNDNAETVLVRLARGHKIPGLIGIPSSVSIPECWGIYGLHRSGRYPRPQIRNREPYFRDKGLDRERIGIEAGGITLYRPLLSFPKERLSATCQSGRIEWAEDLTNKDPTVSIRNAARNLFASKNLPKALQEPSLLKLARSAVVRMQERLTAVNSLVRATKFDLFDLRSGHIRFQLPKIYEPVAEPTAQRTFSEQQHFELTLYLRELVMLVTPSYTVSSDNIKNAVNYIFGTKENSPKAFTAGSVIFRRESSSYSTCPSKEQQDGPPTGHSLPQVWSISRQPYNSNEPTPLVNINPNPSTGPFEEIPFKLWDGRFWIRVCNLTDQLMCIRPLRKNDLKHFREGLPNAQKIAFSRILKSAAPGDVKWTLPVVALVYTHMNNEGGRVIALPSLGALLPQWQDKVRWSIKYKSIDAYSEGSPLLV